MITLNSGDLDTLVRFSRIVEDDGPMGAGKATLTKVVEVMANVLDQLPSAGLSSDAGGDGRRSRVRIRYRTDITPDLIVIFGGRTRKIISGPSILGKRAGLEMMVEDYQVQGGFA